MTSHFGVLLRDLRRKAGLTQEALADRAELGVRTLRRLERGSHGDVRTGTLERLAGPLAGALRRPTEDVLRELHDVYYGSGPSPTREPESDGPGSEPEKAPPAVDLAVEVQAPEVPRVAPAHWIPLTEAIDALAREVRISWSREEDQRRVHDPFPLPVRWRTRGDMADHPANILDSPPGVEPDAPDLSGGLENIARIYRSIPSGRMAVLGEAGSGKTILTLRFVLDFLDSRSPDEPVPVIFSLGSWDPTAADLDDWLVERLLRDHPGLNATGPGGTTLAEAMVEAKCILPVLDGFDELAEGLHAAALQALNSAPKLRLLLTSRTDQFAAVAENARLTRAAVVELDVLSREDLANYLPRTALPARSEEHSGTTKTAWTPIFERLDGQSSSDTAAANLVEALRTPLMVGLARASYGDVPGEDPTELLDVVRFPTPEALEDHLLGGFVRTVYRSRGQSRNQSLRQKQSQSQSQNQSQSAESAEQYLGYLARNLEYEEHEGRDLAWWQLAAVVRPRSRILAVVIACSLITSISVWLVLPVVFALQGAQVGFILRGTLIESLLFGPAVGLAFGLVYGFMTVLRGMKIEPSRLQLQLPSRRRLTGDLYRQKYRGRFYGGLFGGLTVGLGYGPALSLTDELLFGARLTSAEVLKGTFVNILVFGIIFGTSAGPTFGFVSLLEAPIDLGTAATPVSLLTANRRTVLRQSMVLMPMFTLLILLLGRAWASLLSGPVLGPLQWPWSAGIFIGLVGGLTGAGSYAVSFTAWGQWLLFGRIWLPLSGRLPRAPIAFLEDAHRRGVLRQAGAVYQFRHARLQEHLRRHTQDPPPRFRRR